jgi:hypothetical protein
MRDKRKTIELRNRVERGCNTIIASARNERKRKEER